MSILHNHRHHTNPVAGLRRPNNRPATSTPNRVRYATVLPPPPLTTNQTRNQPNRPKPNDPGLRSTWAHRAWLAGGCTTLLASLAKSISCAIASHAILEPALAGVAGYILADLGSGVYHWGIDNYGNATTPVFGSQIDAFQGHHRWPWTITKRQFANNLHVLARVILVTVFPIHVLSHDPALHAFAATFGGCIMLSQQFHAWAHVTKSKLPTIVVALQDAGVLVSRTHHALHHSPPYNNNYCIVSGAWNGVLDRNKVFEAIEMVLFFRLGVRPRSWSEPGLEWKEDADLGSAKASE